MVKRMAKRILVTGSNCGGAFIDSKLYSRYRVAICEGILRKHPHVEVLIGSKDADEEVASVVSEMKALGVMDSIARIEPIRIDIEDEESVQSAVGSIAEKYGSVNALYGIVNNTGVSLSYSLRDIMQTSFYGTIRITNAFLPMLQLCKGRIVNISGESAPLFLSRCTGPELQLFTSSATTLDMLEAHIDYTLSEAKEHKQPSGFSNACLNLLTMIQARDNPSLVINSCAPGLVRTTYLRDGLGTSTNVVDAAPLAPLNLLFGDAAAIGSGYYYGKDARRSPLDEPRQSGFYVHHHHLMAPTIS